MNRLEHNRADLSQSAENLSDAEICILDTDYAQEYMNYVKQNIQIQAAQAMLAHSNQDASRVLQLIIWYKQL